MAFVLDHRIEAASLMAGRHAEFQVRLVNDERFFWVLLVPECEGIVELHDLDPKTNADLMQLAAALGAALQHATGAKKINTAAIGNAVSQFHLHVIARHTHDESWPAPVWGRGTAGPLLPETKAKRLEILGEFLTTLG
ncbi:HIT domain-containing protein [bacterium]|nr:HIT domain-containing protein [bacterium]